MNLLKRHKNVLFVVCFVVAMFSASSTYAVTERPSYALLTALLVVYIGARLVRE